MTAWICSRSFRNALAWAVLTMTVGVFALVLVRTAWLCDDAYISFRTVDNVVHGYGPRWNVAERVQAFTHPLWLFLHVPFYFFTGEIFLTSILISIVLSVTAVGWMAFGLARSPMAAVLGVTVLLFSRAFVDYATSGLENPLTYLLLAAFLAVYFRLQWGEATLFWMALIAALATLNRMDTILFYLPALAYAWLSLRTWRATAAAAIGFLPFVAWEVFAVIYYGFPFPNTAYAKLGAGVEPGVLWVQGLHYLGNSLERDPVTAPVIALGVLAGLFVRRGRYVPLALGLVLYLLYVVKIGGDFMTGRFLAAPLFVAVTLLVRLRCKRRPLVWSAAMIAVVWASLSAPHAPITTGPGFGRPMRNFKDEHNICDERQYYFQHASLAKWLEGKRPLPSHRYANEARRYRQLDRPMTKSHGSVGFRGYLAGPKVHITDYYALADPLLARLPAKYHLVWKMGHLARHYPAGYMDTLRSGENHIANKDVAALYDQLALITRGPVWSRERWAAIWRVNLGYYKDLIDDDSFRFPNLRRVSLTAVSAPKPAGSQWNARGNQIITTGGLHVGLGQPQHAKGLELSLAPGNRYRLLLMRDREVAVTLDLPSKRSVRHGLVVYEVAAPGKAVRDGYTGVRIFPYGGNRQYSLGHLRLIP